MNAQRLQLETERNLLMSAVTRARYLQDKRELARLADKLHEIQQRIERKG